MHDELPARMDDLRRLAEHLERDWWWINGALYAIAHVEVEGPGALAALRMQARTIDARRVAISVRLAELTNASERPNGQLARSDSRHHSDRS